eukprot:NODE_435_length_8649_cov_0.394386.p6 type:complete len:130 gc:universal NODE_435_length_8649_cov_0.394386:2375-2764(+)
MLFFLCIGSSCFSSSVGVFVFGKSFQSVDSSSNCVSISTLHISLLIHGRSTSSLPLGRSYQPMLKQFCNTKSAQTVILFTLPFNCILDSTSTSIIALFLIIISSYSTKLSSSTFIALKSPVKIFLVSLG